MHGFELISTLNHILSRDFFTVLEIMLFSYFSYLVQHKLHHIVNVAYENCQRVKVAAAFNELMGFEYQKLVSLVKEKGLPVSDRKKKTIAYTLAVYATSL